MTKGLFVFVNWAILVAFIGVNAYITYRIIRTYGVMLGSLFKKEID